MKRAEAIWSTEHKVHTAKCPYCGEQNTSDAQCSHFVYRDKDHRPVFHFAERVYAAGKAR